jgi:hypothetical protein
VGVRPVGLAIRDIVEDALSAVKSSGQGKTPELNQRALEFAHGDERLVVKRTASPSQLK